MANDILRTMRHSLLFFAAVAMLLSSCGSEPKPVTTEAPRKAEARKIFDEYRRFPKTNLIDTRVVPKELMGKPFMPGGTLARYKKGKAEYEMFLAELPAAEDAALLLLDWKKALTNAKLIPSFGGYFGQDAGRPVFVFPKGKWIAGVAGLAEKEADPQARTLAGQIQ
jgi:hypothetical protein